MTKETMERHSYLRGLFHELSETLGRYQVLTSDMLELQGRIEMAERALTLNRDHLKAAMGAAEIDKEEVPPNWQKVLHRIRFAGARASDACMEILRARGRATTEELVSDLNDGMFRFRTPTPLREINAALLRQHSVTRDGDTWIYEPPVKRPKDVKPTALAS